MRKAPLRRENSAFGLYGLSEESVKIRSRYRTWGTVILWFLLSGLTFVILRFMLTDLTPVLVLAGIGAIKYAVVLGSAYAQAKAKAASYLDDIFELENQDLAAEFIENVAFGGNSETITIDEGRISEKDERSPIILIGGPGKIKVNLGSAALLEKVDGEPEVIYARSEAWKIGSFERIREIGKEDEVGKREYAAINLRDQFVTGLSVPSRTKDGIPIEAQEIKIIFSILRKKQAKEDESDPYSFEPRAVEDLVYKQTIISPPPSKPTGVTFPWDTTVIPLVIYEIERLITSSPLSEILANISQKELDTISKNEETIAQKRVEMTGVQSTASQGRSESLTPFHSRSRITARFYSPEFKEKAAKLGVAIHWIDIGTWKLPSADISGKLKEAWEKSRENAKKRGSIERERKRNELNFLIELVNAVIIMNFDRPYTPSVRLTDKDIDELTKIFEKSSEVIPPLNIRKQLSQQGSKRDAHTVAVDILRAFRRELMAARELILKEPLSPIEIQADIAKIDKAIHDIRINTAHYVKGSS